MSRTKFDDTRIQTTAELCIALEDARTISMQSGNTVQVHLTADVKNGGISNIKIGSTKNIQNISNFLDNGPLTS
jgi:uncharacterized membrane protein